MAACRRYYKQAANATINGNRKNKLTGERIKIFPVSYDTI